MSQVAAESNGLPVVLGAARRAPPKMDTDGAHEDPKKIQREAMIAPAPVAPVAAPKPSPTCPTSMPRFGGWLRYLHAPGVFTIILAQVTAVILRGGVCTDPSMCEAAVFDTHILPCQLLLMSVLVFREKSHAMDVLRCVAACVVLVGAHSVVKRLPTFFGTPFTIVLIYGQVCISLYMYHRFIFHAHWSARTKGFDRWLWNMVRANYVMHYFEHHHVSRTEDDVRKLAKLQKVSLTQEQIQAKYPKDWLLQNFVNYTDRGIAVKGPLGICGAFMFFSILPTGTLCIASYMAGDAILAALHLLGAALGMWQTMVNHDKYHADEDTLESYATSSWLGWLWRSAEMKRVVHEHKLHHDGKNHSRYFSMVPFDCFFVYPLWPEEHMWPTMHATVREATSWTVKQFVKANGLLVRSFFKEKSKLPENRMF